MLKQAIFFILRYSGLRYLFRSVYQKKRITVLMYHDVEVNSFERHIKYLKERYNIISLEELANFYGQNSSLPDYSVLITFDDGHKSNYELLPVIKKYHIPMVIFLCSGIIDTKRKFWWMTDLEKPRIEELKKVSNEDRLSALEEIGHTNDKEYSGRLALNNSEILEMQNYVNFQSHTVFHPILPNCSDEDSEREISESKNQLSSKYGLDINSFAYPNGDYSEREIEYLKKAGYQMAFTTKKGFNGQSSHRYELFRFDTNDTTDINEFAVRASGLWEYLKAPFR